MRKRINLYGAIGEDWWSGVDNTATRFQRDFAVLEADANCTEIAIHINSPGGDVHEGLAIYNTIKHSSKDTTVIIDGIAMSMGAVIALAGKSCHIAQNGLFMLHNASGFNWGNAKQMRKTAEILDTYDTALATSIAGKTGLTVAEVKAQWFDFEDHFMTADEAHTAGLVDSVLDELADIPADVSNGMSPLRVAASLGRHLRPEQESWFAKVANRVAAILQPAPAPAPTPENVIDEPMRISGKLVALTAIFGLTATADEVVEHVPTAEELENLDARLVAAFAAEERVNELTTELEAANAALVAAEALAAEYGGKAGAQPTALPKGDDPDTVNTAGLTSWERKMALKKQNLR